MKKASLQIVAVSALLAVSMSAETTRVENYKSQLRTARAAELPAETARLVTKSHADVADAVTAAISINNASTHLVVGSIAKASPMSAATAAATAITAQPALASAITKAAVSAAPSELSAIVSASCKARPALFYNIGVAAGTVAPKSSDQILSAIVEGVPTLKPIIERAKKEFKAANRAASLALLLKYSDNILIALAKQENVMPEVPLSRETVESMAAKVVTVAIGPPPVQLPPFVGGGTATEVPAGIAAEQDPNSRNYSAP